MEIRAAHSSFLSVNLKVVIKSFNLCVRFVYDSRSHISLFWHGNRIKSCTDEILEEMNLSEIERKKRKQQNKAKQTKWKTNKTTKNVRISN